MANVRELMAYRRFRTEAEMGLASAEASNHRAGIDHWSKRLDTINGRLAQLGDIDAAAERNSATIGASAGAVKDMWRRALARPGTETPKDTTGQTATRQAWRRALREQPPMNGPVGNERPSDYRDE